MKNIILLLVLSVCITSNYAQQKVRTTDFATFKKWSNQVQINGYKQGEVEDESSINYTANYFSGTTKLIQISVSDISHFNTSVSPAQKAQKYLLNGNNAVYYASPENSFLALEFKTQELCVSVAATGKVDKAFLENIITKANPALLISKTVNNDKINWPLSIPASLKIPGAITITKQDPDGVFKESYLVSAKLTPELLSTLKTMMGKYNTNSLTDGIKEKNVQLICSDAEDIQQLTETFKSGQGVSFIYYIQ